jgi:hypothetical protein
VITAENSNDGINFFPIYETEVQTENGQVIIGSYVHEKPMGIMNYYRLKTIDLKTGETHFSNTQAVANTNSVEVSVNYQANGRKPHVYCNTCESKERKVIYI